MIKRYKIGNCKATIEILHDDFCEDPNEWSDGVSVFRADDGRGLSSELQKEFGDKWESIGSRLFAGETVARSGNMYLGIEEYRHGSSAFALCSNRGNFPDRRWDVIPLVGFVKADSGMEKVFSPSLAEDYLKEYEDWINGNCYGYTVSVKDGEGNEAGEDSCCGFIGDQDYCLSSAYEALTDLVHDKWGKVEIEEI